MTRSIQLGAWVLIVAGIGGCATTYTGRKQLAFLPDNTMNEMGVQAFTDMKKQVPADRDAGLNEYVDCVANAIIARAPKTQGSPPSWEIVVFKDDTANAFALPGGKIGVHTGILKVAQTPGQLAAILGHEVAHVLLRHSNERASQTLLAQGAMDLASISTSNMNSGQRQAVMGALGAGAQLGVLLPFSRKHESEADQVGQQIMADAGFDPSQSILLWKNMARASGGQAPPEFLSTHPANETRIRNLKDELPASMKRYEAALQKRGPANCPRR